MNNTEQLLSVLENPEIFNLNRLKAHSDHRYYPSLEEAKNQEEMSWRYSLNGSWRVKYSEIMRIRYYLIGIMMLSLGIALTLRSELGAGSWDALVENLYKLTSISMGVCLFLMASVLLMLASLVKKESPNLCALLVAYFTGQCINFWYDTVLGSVEFETLMIRLMVLLLGLVMIAFGSAMIYVTNLPRNHTETFVFSVVDAFGIQYKFIKTISDLFALGLTLIFGFILKDFSNLGLGTLLSTLFMGIITQTFMPIVGNRLGKKGCR